MHAGATASIITYAEGIHPPLYHNGINILCQDAELTKNSLKIRDYVVVNGAQSISTFKKSKDKLSENLRVVAKIIQINDPDLSRKITINSNNQNAIKPRDLKSTNEIQLRLKAEFDRVENANFDFEIKRGPREQDGRILITNEEAGRLLLAFDLKEPESCHQVYKLFDDKYADIFARPSVTAYRIIFLYLLMERIQAVTPLIDYRPLSKYGLTRFFLLSVVSELMESDEKGKEIIRNPRTLFDNNQVERCMDGIEDILKSIIVDLNYEVEDMAENFDYKGDLKSPNKIKELRDKLLRSYTKDVTRGKTNSLASMLQ